MFGLLIVFFDKNFGKFAFSDKKTYNLVIGGVCVDCWVIWLILIFFLTFIEAATIGLVCIWFIISAIVSLILSFFIDNLFIQFAVFVILGVLLMLATRPLLKKVLKVKEEKTNLDRVIGMEGIVTEKIKKNVIGEVKVDGKRWSAISNAKIEVGEEVIIESIEGVKLIVRKKESE